VRFLPAEAGWRDGGCDQMPCSLMPGFGLSGSAAGAGALVAGMMTAKGERMAHARACSRVNQAIRALAHRAADSAADFGRDVTGNSDFIEQRHNAMKDGLGAKRQELCVARQDFNYLPSLIPALLHRPEIESGNQVFNRAVAAVERCLI
jgi:hypothetical protein